VPIQGGDKEGEEKEHLHVQCDIGTRLVFRGCPASKGEKDWMLSTATNLLPKAYKGGTEKGGLQEHAKRRQKKNCGRRFAV